ncbi:MAG: cbb3-type cytochrome c oxidase subunit 3 [Anaerolineae bacterium]
MKSLIVDGLPGDPRLLIFLLAFMVIFAAVVAWQYRPANRARTDRLARLPLLDED